MTIQEAVKMIDPTAKFYNWSEGSTGWIKGNGWETKITYSEQRAWELAEEIILSLPVAVGGSK